MIRIPPEGPRTLRPFMVLWTGQAFSLLGSQLVQFALIWWLTQQTGSGTVLAIASIVGLVPQIVLGPFIGVLVDRWNRRRTMILADSAVALSTLILAILFWTGSVQIWQVYLILFIRALGGTFHWPAMQASMSLIVPADQLTRTQGLNQILNGGMNILSAPLGALAVSTLSMPAVLSIDLITAAIAIGTLLIVAIPQPPRTATETSTATIRSLAKDFAVGFRYVASWRGLLILGALAMLINMMLTPSSTLMPLLVTEHFQGTAWHLGALEAALGIGVIAGGLLLGIWGGFKNRILTTLVGLVGLGSGVLIIGLTPASLFFGAVAAMLLMGIMSSMTNGPILATFQAVVEPEMQGRVFSLIGSTTAAMMPLGLAIAGPLADIIGVRAWFIVGGLVSIAVGLVSFFIPDLRTLEQGHPHYPRATVATGEDAATVATPLNTLPETNA